MGRTRLGAAAGSLGAGIALHHTTDQAFHSDQWFLDLERELRHASATTTCPTVPRRACAHVGPELLLDGALLDDPTSRRGVSTVYARIAAPADDLVELAPEGDPGPVAPAPRGRVTRLDPFTYGNARSSRERLHHDHLAPATTRVRPRAPRERGRRPDGRGAAADHVVGEPTCSTAWSERSRLRRRVAASHSEGQVRLTVDVVSL